MRVERRFLTLLELMIAIGLTMILLSALTYFYNQVSVVNRQMDEAQGEAFKKLFLENRLSQTLPKANSPTDSKLDFIFYTTPSVEGISKPGISTLLFTFDNCVKLDKDFAYIVLGRLYLDTEGNLILATMPPPKRWQENELPSMKKEILLENVEHLDFQFFAAPDKGKTKKNEEQEEEEIQIERGRWLDVWSKEYGELPAIVRLIIEQEGEREVFAFPLPNSYKKQPITYDQ